MGIGRVPITHLRDGGGEACAVTPETAYAMKVKLEHLRWYASKLSPQKYGPVRPRDAAKAAGHAVMHVYTKRFICRGPDDDGRWSDEPAQHLYSMIPYGDGQGGDGRGGGEDPRAGEALPPPAVIREPASTQGPDAQGEARGGAVEVEFDEPEGGAQDDGDDYWSMG